MNKIVFSAALTVALVGAGGAFAQSAECQARLADGRSVCDVPNPGGRAAPQNHAVVGGGTVRGFGDDSRYYRNDLERLFGGRWNSEQDEYRRNRNNGGWDRDGDGVPNRRDSHPDNPRRR